MSQKTETQKSVKPETVKPTKAVIKDLQVVPAPTEKSTLKEKLIYQFQDEKALCKLFESSNSNELSNLFSESFTEAETISLLKEKTANDNFAKLVRLVIKLNETKGRLQSKFNRSEIAIIEGRLIKFNYKFADKFRNHYKAGRVTGLNPDDFSIVKFWFEDKPELVAKYFIQDDKTNKIKA